MSTNKLDLPNSFEWLGDDNHIDKLFGTTILNLVNSEIDAANAAQMVDNIIVTDCHVAYDSYTSLPKAEQVYQHDGEFRYPNPDGWLAFLWKLLCHVAKETPHSHIGQDRLVGLLRKLIDMPRHKVPWLIPSGELIKKELYVLTKANGYGFFDQWLWEVNEGDFAANHNLATDPQVAEAYLNFSAFVARMLSAGIMFCTRACALYDTPFAGQFIAWTAKYADSAEQVSKYQPYACGAAQWIFHAGDVLYEFSYKGVAGWTRGKWDIIKLKFEEVECDSRFTVEARAMVREAVKRMAKLEGDWVDGPKTNLTDHFGFTPNYVDTDEDDKVEQDDDHENEHDDEMKEK